MPLIAVFSEGSGIKHYYFGELMDYTFYRNIKTDTESLLKLLTESFVCKSETAQLFKEKVLKHSNIFVSLKDNEPSFALIGVPVEINTGSEELKGVYIIPAVKNEGLKIEHKDEIAAWLSEISNHFSAECLVFSPNDEAVSVIFSELGFKNSFTEKILKISKYSAKVLASKDEVTTDKLSFTHFDELSHKFKGAFIKWNNDLFEYFVKSLETAGGEALSLSSGGDVKGYIFGKKSGCIGSIFESVGDGSDLSFALSRIARDEEILECEIFLPLSYPFSADNMDVVSGAMIKPLSEKAENALSKAPLYFGYSPFRRILYSSRMK